MLDEKNKGLIQALEERKKKRVVRFLPTVTVSEPSIEPEVEEDGEGNTEEEEGEVQASSEPESEAQPSLKPEAPEASIP